MPSKKKKKGQPKPGELVIPGQYRCPEHPGYTGHKPPKAACLYCWCQHLDLDPSKTVTAGVLSKVVNAMCKQTLDIVNYQAENIFRRLAMGANTPQAKHPEC